MHADWNHIYVAWYIFEDIIFKKLLWLLVTFISELIKLNYGENWTLLYTSNGMALYTLLTLISITPIAY